MGVRRRFSNLRSLRAVRARRSRLRASATALYELGAIAAILGGKPHYLHHGWFLISVANLIVIVLMIVVFVLAIVVPFPKERDKSKKR